MAGQGVCRLNDKNDGDGFVEETPQTSVFVNGELAAVITSKISDHEDHEDETIIEGDDTVMIEGQAVAYITCKNSCDHVMVDGSGNVFVGGNG